MLSTMAWRMVRTNNDGGISLGVARVTPDEVFVASFVALILADGKALSAISLGLAPTGNMLSRLLVEVRMTATSPDRASTTNSKFPAFENVIESGPSPVRGATGKSSPSSMLYTPNESASKSLT